MQHYIRAQFQRVLIDGCRESIIHNNQRTHRFCDRSKTFYVRDFDGRVSRCLQVEHLATLVDFGFNLLVIAGLAQGHVNVQWR